MSEESNYNRRYFLGTAATTLAAPGIVLAGFSSEKSNHMNLADTTGVRSGSNNSFDTIKQINAGELNIGYAEAGPENGTVVILLHGWPYDIYSFTAVAPLLVSSGYRVIIPWLRGYGTTTFISDKTLRNAQQSVLAIDVINLMDALKIRSAIIGGFDWGARTANIVAALWPDRCRAMVSVSGYLIGNQEVNKMPLPPAAELQWWYQFYFATDRGRVGYDKYRHDFSKLIWKTASPKWNFDDATFDKTAASSITLIMLLS
jgi:pimeloyl-ACP methyl ester carboxylesterase